MVFVSSFIRLADYLIVNTMHVLAANSVATLLNYLEEQLQHTPTPAQMQGTTEEMKSEEEKPTEGESVEQKVFLLSIYIKLFVVTHDRGNAYTCFRLKHIKLRPHNSLLWSMQTDEISVFLTMFITVSYLPVSFTISN